MHTINPIESKHKYHCSLINKKYKLEVQELLLLACRHDMSLDLIEFRKYLEYLIDNNQNNDYDKKELYQLKCQIELQITNNKKNNVKNSNENLKSNSYTKILEDNIRTNSTKQTENNMNFYYSNPNSMNTSDPRSKLKDQQINLPYTNLSLVNSSESKTKIKEEHSNLSYANNTGLINLSELRNKSREQQYSNALYPPNQILINSPLLVNRPKENQGKECPFDVAKKIMSKIGNLEDVKFTIAHFNFGEYYEENKFQEDDFNPFIFLRSENQRLKSSFLRLGLPGTYDSKWFFIAIEFLNDIFEIYFYDIEGIDKEVIEDMVYIISKCLCDEYITPNKRKKDIASFLFANSKYKRLCIFNDNKNNDHPKDIMNHIIRKFANV